MKTFPNIRTALAKVPVYGPLDAATVWPNPTVLTVIGHEDDIDADGRPTAIVRATPSFANGCHHASIDSVPRPFERRDTTVGVQCGSCGSRYSVAVGMTAMTVAEAAVIEAFWAAPKSWPQVRDMAAALASHCDAGDTTADLLAYAARAVRADKTIADVTR